MAIDVGHPSPVATDSTLALAGADSFADYIVIHRDDWSTASAALHLKKLCVQIVDPPLLRCVAEATWEPVQGDTTYVVEDDTHIVHLGTLERRQRQ